MERITTTIPQAEVDPPAAILPGDRPDERRPGETPLAFVDTYGCQQNEADSERIGAICARWAMTSPLTRSRPGSSS